MNQAMITHSAIKLAKGMKRLIQSDISVLFWSALTCQRFLAGCQKRRQVAALQKKLSCLLLAFVDRGLAQNFFLRCLARIELGHQTAAPHYQNSISHAQQLR